MVRAEQKQTRNLIARRVSVHGRLEKAVLLAPLDDDVCPRARRGPDFYDRHKWWPLSQIELLRDDPHYLLRAPRWLYEKKGWLPKLTPARRRLLAQAHQAKKQLGMDDETWRAFLRRTADASTCAALDEAELEKVLAELRRMGFRERQPGWRPKSPKPWVRKVYALWGEAKRSGAMRDRRRSALRAFVNRQTGVEDPEWLTPQQAEKVIEAFKALIARERKKEGSEK